MTKIIQSDGSLGSCLGKTVGNVGKKALLGLAVLSKDVLPKLAIKATSSLLHKFKTNISLQGVVEKSAAGPVRAEEDSLCSFQMNIWMILLKL